MAERFGTVYRIAIFCTVSYRIHRFPPRPYRAITKLHYPFADVAILSSENANDKKAIVHTLSLKEGFLWGYI